MNQFNTGKIPFYRFNLKGAVVLFLGAFIPTFALSTISVAVLFMFNKNIQYDHWFLILTNAMMWLGAIFAFDIFVCRKQTGQPLKFNFSSKNTTTYLTIFPMLIGMMLIAEFITLQVPTTGKFWGSWYQEFEAMMAMLTDNLTSMVIMAVIMAPVFEEIVFRGIIQKGLINNGISPQKAIWLSAILFGLVHGNPWQLIGGILLGYVLGLVYFKTKSLLMPILLHAFNNGVSALLIVFGETESFSEFFNISEYWLLGIGLFLFITFYMAFSRLKIYHS